MLAVNTKMKVMTIMQKQNISIHKSIQYGLRLKKLKEIIHCRKRLKPTEPDHLCQADMTYIWYSLCHRIYDAIRIWFRADGNTKISHMILLLLMQRVFSFYRGMHNHRLKICTRLSWFEAQKHRRSEYSQPKDLNDHESLEVYQRFKYVKIASMCSFHVIVEIIYF